MTKPYETNLDQVPANYQPLTPLGLLSRAATVHPNHTAVIHGDWRCTYQQFYARCCRLAGALSRRGIGPGDTVAILAPNVPAHLEAHYGVPMTGAILNAINTRLDSATVRFILEHGNAKVLFADREFSSLVKESLDKINHPLLVIDIDDPLADSGELIGSIDYENFILEGADHYPLKEPKNEWQAITLNYTSGTTGNPKGVVYHHRGALLNALGNVLAWNMPRQPVYLWTLPMFHCNGWCFTWSLSAVAGTHVCLRHVDPSAVYNAILDHHVTHFCGAPIVLNMLAGNPPKTDERPSHVVEVMTAGAPPPPSVITAAEEIGLHVTHVYGLTETYGPAVVCEWHSEWDDQPKNMRASLKARQGVRYPVLESLSVRDPVTMQPVPADGQTMGEVMMQGNTVMKGYLNNPKETEQAFQNDWFHSGDLGVVHENGYLELKDRSKDIIISGGENISTIEVETVLYQHPEIVEAAVVSTPDQHWGEVPCAFIALKPGTEVTSQSIIDFCRDRLAHFKVPKQIVFGNLPKTSTGKIQKYILRKRAKAD